MVCIEGENGRVLLRCREIPEQAISPYSNQRAQGMLRFDHAKIQTPILCIFIYLFIYLFVRFTNIRRDE